MQTPICKIQRMKHTQQMKQGPRSFRLVSFVEGVSFVEQKCFICCVCWVGFPNRFATANLLLPRARRTVPPLCRAGPHYARRLPSLCPSTVPGLNRAPPCPLVRALTELRGRPGGLICRGRRPPGSSSGTHPPQRPSCFSSPWQSGPQWHPRRPFAPAARPWRRSRPARMSTQRRGSLQAVLPPPRRSFAATFTRGCPCGSWWRISNSPPRRSSAATYPRGHLRGNDRRCRPATSSVAAGGAPSGRRRSHLPAARPQQRPPTAARAER